MQKLIHQLCVFLILLLVFQGMGNVFAQHFEGEILFVKETMVDTNLFSYKIRGNKVRFEELDHQKRVEKYIIADFSKNSLVTINPEKKLYKEIKVYPWKNKSETLNFKINKTGNYKIINGYKCYQWRILNKKENTEINFWTASGPFRFFSEFTKMLNPPDKSSQYYLIFPEIHDMIPFESVERSILREMRMRTGVISIEKKSLQQHLFEIPAGFRKL